MPVGGAERVLVDILNNIDYSKYQISLLLKNNEGGMITSVNPNVPILSLEGPFKCNLYTRIKGRLLRYLKLDDIIERKKTRSLIEDRYDTIISFCQGTAHKLHSYIIEYADNNMSWVHSDLSKGNWGLSLFHNSLKDQEQAYNRMNSIVFVSNGARDTFNSIFKIDSRVNLMVLYNTVDKKSIEQKSKEYTIDKPKGKTVFINVGRLVDAKQQIRLLEAANIIKKQSQLFEIWILGEGPLRNQLEEYIGSNDLRTYVKLMGNQSNPYTYLASSDVFVLTSRQEGYPMVICEAFCLSKPVISTDIIGPREVLDNGKYGLMVSENSEAIANAMILFMNDSTKKAYYTNQAILRADSFSTDEFMNSLYSIL